jgi:hypothetical protein
MEKCDNNLIENKVDVLKNMVEKYREEHPNEPTLKIKDITYSACNDPVLICEVVPFSEGGDVNGSDSAC